MIGRLFHDGHFRLAPRVRALWVAALPVAALGGVWGCGKEEERPLYHEVQGKVTAIDEETGKFTVEWYNKKRQQRMTHEGTLAPDADILINGRTASPGDVHIDDRVTVTVRDDSGDRANLVATRVLVERPEMPLETSQPSSAQTQPSG